MHLALAKLARLLKLTTSLSSPSFSSLASASSTANGGLGLGDGSLPDKESTLVDCRKDLHTLIVKIQEAGFKTRFQVARFKKVQEPWSQERKISS